MPSPEARQFFGLLNEHLSLRNETSLDESGRGDLSIIAEGAAFELWLSFEARIVLERNRGLFQDRQREFWTANEYKKVDLSAWHSEDDEDRCRLAVEFKVVHNNKNWKSKCDEVRKDLVPRAGSRKAGLPVDERVAIVAVVFKTYEDASAEGYPGQQTDKLAWRRKVEKRLKKGKLRNATVTAGPSFPICSPYLDEDHSDHSVELWMVSEN